MISSRALDSEVVDNFDGSYTVTNKVTQCAVLAVQTKVQAAFERRKAFWMHAGKTRSRACQFVLAGADDWYLESPPRVDEESWEATHNPT